MGVSESRDDTTLAVRQNVAERFKSEKPWESISHTEFLEHLLNVYGEHEGN